MGEAFARLEALGVLEDGTRTRALDVVPSVTRTLGECEVMEVGGSPRVVTTGQVHDDPHVAEPLRATAVIGVGTGVQPDEYPLLEPLQAALGGAALAASRKVTDRGWLPRSRQVGVTGHSIAPASTSPSASPESSTT